MKFIVSRTSDSENKPCEGAFFEEYIQVDEITLENLYKIPAYQSNKKAAENFWYNRGDNHRTENGILKREFKREGWFIEINSLEELTEFIKKQDHEIILGSSYKSKKLFEIEIYDDYRE